jgi:hypothetical protein
MALFLVPIILRQMFQDLAFTYLMLVTWLAQRAEVKELCLHSQEVAIKLSYSAMQLNSVVSTNNMAVK